MHSFMHAIIVSGIYASWETLLQEIDILFRKLNGFVATER